MKPNTGDDTHITPNDKSKSLLASIRAAAKLLEFEVPKDYQINFTNDPMNLVVLAIGILGDMTDDIINGDHRRIHELANQNIRFVAQYFDSVVASERAIEIEDQMCLFGAVAYYFSSLPGSSAVLANQIDEIDLEAAGLDKLLSWVVKSDYANPIEIDSKYSEAIYKISNGINAYYQLEQKAEVAFEEFHVARNQVYESGTAIELLILDCSFAMFKAKVANSVIDALPEYTGQSLEGWIEPITNDRFIKELWPAQHLIGRHGVYKGASAVAQMPTSAGKTKAIEIIIRSSMIAGRSNMAVIVAPFKSLCNEISASLKHVFWEDHIKINEVTDVLQFDLETMSIEENYVVMVVTPEKLLYLLRQMPELAEDIGLVIFDEGHQFDNGTRGITYELLTTSIKMSITHTAQIVLISAVISNANDIGTWLCGTEVEVVRGEELVPTARSIAFASWATKLGQLMFVDKANPENIDHFVPMIIDSVKLESKGRDVSGQVKCTTLATKCSFI